MIKHIAAPRINVLLCDEWTKVSPDGTADGGALLSASRGITLHGGRGEVVSFQLVIAAERASLKDVTLEFEPLASQSAGAIEPENIEPFLVGFVHSPSVGYRNWRPSSWRPDPLFTFHPFDVISGDYQPIWINLIIPRETVGKFKGHIIVHAKNRSSARIPIQLTVWNFEIPRQTSLHNLFDFGIAEKLSGFEKLYGPLDAEGFEPFSRFMRYLSDHKVTGMWYAHFLSGGLVEIREENGRFSYELSRARRAIKLMAELKLGFNHWLGPIWSDPDVYCNLYPVFERFRQLGKQLYANETFNRCVLELAVDFYRQAKKAGLATRTHAYFYDEPVPELEPHMELLSHRLKEQSPESQQVIATGSVECIRDILRKDLPVDVIIGHLSFYDGALRRHIENSGRAYWWYTSNWWEPAGSHLSFWIDEPMLHHRMLYWLTWRYRVPGFGYWNTNTWNYLTYDYDNIKENRRMEWPYGNWNVANNGSGSGDGQLVYPGSDGPIGSMRFEAIRHGWQDHACLTLLEQKLAESRGSRLRSSFVGGIKRSIGGVRSFARQASVLKNIRRKIGAQLSAPDGPL